jgi:F0F1-type ATP synthase membrane subunit b/b'
VKLSKEYDIEVSDEENKSLAHPLTREQLDDLAEGRHQADIEQIVLDALSDIRESVDQVTQAVAKVLERSARRQKQISGPPEPDMESMRARARVRAIAATL